MGFGGAVSAVAHCRAVSENVVRVQLPGGSAFAPAIRQAAEKTASRTTLDETDTNTIGDIVAAAVEALNGGGVSSISLELTVHDAALGVRLLGKQKKKGKKPSAAALEHLDSVAAASGVDVATTANKASFRIDFEVPARP